VNQCQLIGHAGRNATLKYTPNGMAVLEFSIATNSKKKDGTKETFWHNIVVYGQQAEALQNEIMKGSEVWVHGKIQTRSWQDKEGQTKYKTEIIGQWVRAYNSKVAAAPTPSNNNEFSATSSKFTEDDIPF
jgi:single-strand DNA-binding protein